MAGIDKPKQNFHMLKENSADSDMLPCILTDFNQLAPLKKISIFAF